MPNFTFRLTSSGDAIKEPVDFGTVSNAASGGTSTKSIYISHDSSSSLNNVGVYIQPYSGSGYVGNYGSSQDWLDVCSWGLQTNEGLNINMDAAAGSQPFDNYVKSGGSPVGISAVTAIPLSTAVFGAGIGTSPGHFPNGQQAKLNLEMSVPTTETNTGLRMVSLFLKFDQ